MDPLWRLLETIEKLFDGQRAKRTELADELSLKLTPKWQVYDLPLDLPTRSNYNFKKSIENGKVDGSSARVIQYYKWDDHIEIKN